MDIREYNRMAWFPDLAGIDILCLASGGGQQGPVLAAAGAKVTVLDNSPRQLEGDRFVPDVRSAWAEAFRVLRRGGVLLAGFFEDAYGEEENGLLTNYMPTFIATRAIKPYHKTREEGLV